MVKNKELEGKDICIVDPPRKGMSEEVLAALLSPQGPKRLIYISCGFKAFQRDFATLTSNNSNYSYDLIHAEGHILFPGSDHLETVAIFDKVGTIPWEEEKKQGSRSDSSLAPVVELASSNNQIENESKKSEKKANKEKKTKKEKKGKRKEGQKAKKSK